MRALEHSGAFGEFGGDGVVGGLEHFGRELSEGYPPPRGRAKRGASTRIFSKFFLFQRYLQAAKTD